MNYRSIFHQLGLLLVVVSVVLAGLGAFSALQLQLQDDALRPPLLKERPAMLAFFASATVGVVAGGFIWLVSRGKDGGIGRRESMLLVALGWIVATQLAAFPYLFWSHWAGAEAADHPFLSNVNCYFETMSGLTTTGATILTEIASLPRSIHLWRAMTHWLGGLGIVVLFVAVLPALGVGGKRLFKVEAPGPTQEGMRPNIRHTARILWFIYLGLTIAQVLALHLAGLDWFESTCHTFATLATGGFSTRNGSVGEINVLAVDIIIIVFMMLAGANFGLYYQLFQGRFRNLWRDVELRLYLLLLIGGSLIVSLAIWHQPLLLTTGEQVGPSGADALRHGFFTTVSIQTTTGFATTDFNPWPFLAHAVLITLMFVGGCAGSTSGGIKVIRIWVAIKVMLSEIESAFRPNVVRPVRIGVTAIDPALKLATLAYVIGIFVLFALGAGAIMMLEPSHHRCDFTTAATASLATLCTIGPGLNKVGAIENYGWFTDGSKIVMTVLMLIGRLEVFAVIVLFSPKFWRSR